MLSNNSSLQVMFKRCTSFIKKGHPQGWPFFMLSRLAALGSDFRIMLSSAKQFLQAVSLYHDQCL